MTKLFPARKLLFTNQSGFTLVEVMIVILILGIIFSFGTSLYRQYTEKSNLAMAQSMLSTYSQELVVFQLKAGRLPKNDQEYETLQNQLKLDPSKDLQYREYFSVVPDFKNHYLLAVPQKKHPFHSYARMNLKNYSIEVCHKTPEKFKAEGGECQKTITGTILNQ